MSPRRARLYVILLFMGCLAIAAGLVLFALRNNISYFRTPTEIASGHFPERESGRGFRLGGLVEKGSLRRDGSRLSFRVTDMENSLEVQYQGVTPDLFREGQGVIAEGKVNAEGVFIAQKLLAKHDEKYMPPEVAKALKGKNLNP